MFATDFEESNTVVDKPEDMSRDGCDALNTFVGRTPEGYPVIISCWKPTKEELEEINKTGRVWCMMYSHGLPPHVLLGTNPFEEA